jgi:hypothetical protein
MRSYIFTDTEREAIQLFLSGEIKGSDPKVAHILSRVRSFRELASDVEFYLMLRKAISANST